MAPAPVIRLHPDDGVLIARSSLHPRFDEHPYLLFFPAVLIAAYIVRELPLYAVRWLVIVVVVYAALSMLLSARAERGVQGAIPATSRR